jgi:hypothetical protein
MMTAKMQGMELLFEVWRLENGEMVFSWMPNRDVLNGDTTEMYSDLMELKKAISGFYNEE